MLASKSYIPILKTGIAEIDAYRNLYGDVKSASFPFFVIRPWPNANHLSYAVDKVVEAASNLPFALSLDHSRLGHPSPKAAQGEFNALFRPEGGYLAYYQFLQGIDGASPVLFPTADVGNLVSQISNADHLGRGLIVHQRRGGQINLIALVSEVHHDPQECTYIIDAGWTRDYTAMESWCLPLMNALPSNLHGAEFVIACSSFPDSFSHIVGNAEEIGCERRLFNAVRQQHNQLDLKYGDWGSTRVANPGGGGTIPSRVDLPKFGSWEIFRANPDNDQGFYEMAWEAQHHPSFADTPNCWGKDMITFSDDEGAGIQSRHDSTMVRINVHLTVQSGATSVLPTDEIPYTD